MCRRCRNYTRDTVRAVVEKLVENRRLSVGERIHEERKIG
jgi:hypothetical protein